MSQVILPTATNFITFMGAKLLEARRAGVEPELELETQRRRAWMIVKETGPLPVAAVTR